MSQKLTPKLIHKIFPEQNSKEVERLDVSAKDIAEVGDLTTCPRLIRIDLSQNAIQDVSFASTCKQLKWLSLANNPIADLGPLQCLTNLQVLNVGQAKLSGKIRIEGLDHLGALILTDNQITAVLGLKRLPNLNTLVLKHNAIKELGGCLRNCSGLQKLSMAHNQLGGIGDALSQCTALKELRLNHNAIARLPAELAANSQLRILDLGDNPIADTDALQVLASLPWLRNLNLKGCSVSQRQDYPQSILRMLPNLEILDNSRLAQRSKQPKAALQTPPAPRTAVPRTADAAQHHAADDPHRKDRSKSASTSAGLAGKDRVAKNGRERETRESEAGPREGLKDGASGREAKQKKKRALPEEKLLGVNRQTGVVDGAADRDVVRLEKKQRLQDKDRGSDKRTPAPVSSTAKKPADKVASKASAAEQEGPVQDRSAPHRPPVVGVFETRTDANGKIKKETKKAAALARGAQAAALLAAEPDALGTASGWSWEP